jgi:hypothetical protein
MSGVHLRELQREGRGRGGDRMWNVAVAMRTGVLAIVGRSYWIPGSWNLRMSYTDDIPFSNP